MKRKDPIWKRRKRKGSMPESKQAIPIPTDGIASIRKELLVL